MKFVSPIENLYKHITYLAIKYPEREALFSMSSNGDVGDAITYRQLQNTIQDIALKLRHELKLQPGDALGLAMPNSVELLMVSWAAWAAGIITVPLDIRRDTFDQYFYKIKLTKTKVLLATNDIFEEKDKKQLSRSTSLVDFQEFFASPNSGKSLSWQKGLTHTALYLFTSGTTAAPKGAELTLENLVANADGIKDWMEIESTDRFLALLPLYHINSTTFCLSVLLAGGSIAVPPGYSNSRFWEQLAKTKSTFTSIVPTICFDQLSRQKEFQKIKNNLKVNRIQIGSAPVVVEDVKQFMKQFDVPLYQGYGQTETALRVTGVPLNLNRGLYQTLIEENSIGKAMRWAEAIIMDKEGGNLPEEKEGELAVRGPIVMKGYLKNPKANKEGFRNGYFLTGDIGYYRYIQNTPYFFLKGRTKEIIIKGGINLSPVAIESKLKQINKNIDQVYVIGVPDRRYGEEVAAVLCWKKSKKSVEQLEAELKYQLTSRLSAIMPIEVPQYITSMDASQLPVTSTGKIQRSVLKHTISRDSLESTNLVASNKKYTFLRLTSDNRPYSKQSFELFNYCWHPLAIDMDSFGEQIKNGTVILGIDKKTNKVEGLITMLRTSLSKKALSKTNYQKLTGNATLNTNQGDGNKIVCVSICSSNYKQPKAIAEPDYMPSASQMKKYVQFGLDHVYNFHLKSKGGLKGAKLVAMMPNSRPEDTMSLGYNMLMEYPRLPKGRLIIPDEKASVAVQLIEAAMHFAQGLNIAEVLVYSRPANAHQHFSDLKTF